MAYILIGYVGYMGYTGHGVYTAMVFIAMQTDLAYIDVAYVGNTYMWLGRQHVYSYGLLETLEVAKPVGPENILRTRSAYLSLLCPLLHIGPESWRRRFIQANINRLRINLSRRPDPSKHVYGVTVYATAMCRTYKQPCLYRP